ncbi:MAG: ribosome small subunit-dependent GTPase A [Clostridia bacterium]|nr:ribosome small subunit-dependent GTPase A [Clostridia bacterium]
MEGVIIKGMGGLYTARDAQGETYVLRCKGKFRRMHMAPLVGDRIVFTPGAGDQHGWLDEILPRISESLRPPVANVELMMLVMAPAPAPDLLLIDRLMIRARRQQIQPIIVLNKCDLDETGLAEEIAQQYADAQTPFFKVSAREGIGLEALKKAMAGKLTCFAGQSGVGKSTLLNALFGWELKTGEISQKIARGRHTTRHAEMMEQDGLRVLDTPGFSMLDLEDRMDPVLLQQSYPEFEPYLGQCRFAPCYHHKEPGCRILEAAKEGCISPQRLERYHHLLELAKEEWRNRYD